MSKRIFIDGMNVIRSNPSLAKIEAARGNAAARKDFVRLVDAFAAREGGGAEWTVVFDGGGTGPGDVERAGRAIVIYAGERTADEVIVQLASDAVALTHDTVIVSNDAEVRCEGASTVRSEEFYEDLIRRPPSRKETDFPGRAAGLIEHLANAGHLLRNSAEDPALPADLAAQLEYFSTRSLPPNKLANKLDAFLRERAAVTPNPDPQKVFLRAIKAFFDGIKP